MMVFIIAGMRGIGAVVGRDIGTGRGHFELGGGKVGPRENIVELQIDPGGGNPDVLRAGNMNITVIALVEQLFDFGMQFFLTAFLFGVFGRGFRRGRFGCLGGDGCGGRCTIFPFYGNGTMGRLTLHAPLHFGGSTLFVPDAACAAWNAARSAWKR